MPSTCMNNTSCNQLKVVTEPEIKAPRDNECQHGVGDTQAAGRMQHSLSLCSSKKLYTLYINMIDFFYLVS